MEQIEREKKKGAERGVEKRRGRASKADANREIGKGLYPAREGGFPKERWEEKISRKREKRDAMKKWGGAETTIGNS